MAKKKAKKAKKAKATYDPIAYVNPINPGTYTSAYADQLANARNQLLNFKYDPLQDAQYQAMAQVYGARGNQAAQDTLGEAASLNGGMQTSYAVSAAQQARNQYNQELAALVPEFEQNAYNRLQGNYGVLMDADTEAYQRYRDQVADYQWGKGYDTDIYQFKLAQAGSGGGGGGGGGGRRRSSGGGRGYSGGGSSASLKNVYEKAAAQVNKKQAAGPKPNVPQTIAAIAKSAANNSSKKKKK